MLTILPLLTTELLHGRHDGVVIVSFSFWRARGVTRRRRGMCPCASRTAPFRDLGGSVHRVGRRVTLRRTRL